ncbi:hypothetical protein [Nostoc sp. TCL26-01]|uniref:hypothetical protein n=1 Tax=Nostoc sp. TCL26-01 TaxID=2576904 RepID=UPI0015B9711E|nr:hypothetical protein [Nostoc sp. TCL26-01]QLE54826.1 hypothetical protein FD725_04430 [Nostoc sp. TCL26-01]QLE58754.1 hypothetical protein FD725_26575 [Nostoc sp. TCL26-01]
MKQFWYIEPKGDNKYASVGCSDWHDANSKIEFSELGFCQDDDFYHVFAYATKFSEIQVFNDKNWKFEPQLVKFKVAKKDYQKEDREKNKVDVKQSRLERWLCHLFNGLEEGVIYSGFINLKDDPYCDLFTKGVDFDGNPIDPLVLTQMLKMSVVIKPVESPEQIKPEDIKAPNSKSGFSKGGYSGKPAQTELEKLSDRLSFVCSQVNAMGEGVPVENLAQLADILATAANKKAIQEVFTLCTALIS